MKQFYTIFELNFKTVLSFINELPNGSSYAMRR